MGDFKHGFIGSLSTKKANPFLTTKTEVVFRKKGKKLPNHRLLRLVSDVGQILSFGFELVILVFISMVPPGEVGIGLRTLT